MFFKLVVLSWGGGFGDFYQMKTNLFYCNVFYYEIELKLKQAAGDLFSTNYRSFRMHWFVTFSAPLVCSVCQVCNILQTVSDWKQDFF